MQGGEGSVAAVSGMRDAGIERHHISTHLSTVGGIVVLRNWPLSYLVPEEYVDRF